VSGQPQNVGLGRVLAARRRTQTGAIWRPASDGSGMQLHTASVACYVYTPGTPQTLQVLADLGGARASAVGEVAFDAAVLEGDELRIGSTVYTIERAVAHATLTYLALSEQK